MAGFKLPSGRAIAMGVLMTAISLVALRMIGAAVPQLRDAPVIGAVFG